MSTDASSPDPQQQQRRYREFLDLLPLTLALALCNTQVNVVPGTALLRAMSVSSPEQIASGEGVAVATGAATTSIWNVQVVSHPS